MAWHLRGSYLESCNCDPICPCRRVDGVPGGRSTHGVCMGILTWLVEDGEADGTDLVGAARRARAALQRRRARARRGRGSSTWTPARRTSAARAARGDLHAAGSAATHGRTSPGRGRRASWSRCGSVEIEVDHTRQRQWLRIRDHAACASATASRTQRPSPASSPATIGTARSWWPTSSSSRDGPLAFEHHAVCGVRRDVRLRRLSRRSPLTRARTQPTADSGRRCGPCAPRRSGRR